MHRTDVKEDEMMLTKENMRKAIIVETPLECPWRLEEMGKYGCGGFSKHDYLHARKHPCPCNEEFPDNCPLDSVIPEYLLIFQGQKQK